MTGELDEDGGPYCLTNAHELFAMGLFVFLRCM